MVLILFSDFECSYCARSARDVLPEIDRQYVQTGKVLLVWKHFPIPSHVNAQKAAEAAECAARQGKFWEFHNWAFAQQTELNVATLRTAASPLGLDASTFGSCLEGEMAARVVADFESGKGLSIAGTPTWFVGARLPDGRVKVSNRLDGAKRLSVLQMTLERAIAAAGGASN